MAFQTVGKRIDVKTILSKVLEGSTKDFDIFVSNITNPDVTDKLLIEGLRGLKDCITLLREDFQLLVSVILKINWACREPKVVREYQSFITNLVSAHTVYLAKCLVMIVRQFMPAFAKGEAVDTIKDDVRKRHNQNFLNLHQLLKSLLHLVPLAPVVLLPLLSDCFPYMTKAAYLQECYVRNLLQLSTYLIKHRMKILELIVDRMTKIDVRCSREAIHEAEEEAEDREEEMDAVFSMDLESPDGGQITQPDTNATPMPHQDAEKLDILMELMFTYIRSVCYTNDVLDWEATKKLYRELLAVFDRIILPTHASCHIQFLLFYIISFKGPLVEGFLDYLWKKLQDPNTPSVFRQAAISYTASLLARANFIEISIVRSCLDLMVSWVHYYNVQLSTSTYTLLADVHHHGTFYSVCQAIFYVFVFKHKDFLAMEKGEKFLQLLNLQTIVTSRLNPLRICLPIVANTFSSITREHQLAFCDTILEHNRRNNLPVAGSGISAPTGLTQVNPLDSFFPFDPYLLRRSGACYVRPLYTEFGGAMVEEEVADEQDIEAEEEAAYASGGSYKCPEIEAMNPHSPSSHFIVYGTSPGFKTMTGIS